MFPCLENNPVDAVFALTCDAGGGAYAVTLYDTGNYLTNLFFAIMTMSKYGIPCFGKSPSENLTFEYLISRSSFGISPSLYYITLIAKTIISTLFIRTKIFTYS